jgi:DNA-binding NtrC family response regulator
VKSEDVLRLLDAAADPDAAHILDALIQVSRAERGFLVLRENGELAVRTAHNMDGDGILRAREKVSRTVLDRVLAEGRPFVASDADIAGIGSLQEKKVRSVCAIPLRASEGAVYLDHRFEKGLFDDLALLDEIAARLDKALHAARKRDGFGDLVGSSKSMQDLFRALDRVARSPYPVLVYGESGTGKELVARAIHRRGPRAKGSFVAANCATLPEQLIDSELFGHTKGAFTGADRERPGLFEQAHGGVLFLDEIACLSAGAQESFLRVLETGETRRLGSTRSEQVDVRVVAATNEELERAEGFRKDLFYRLNVLRLDLPALRDHKEDLPLLTDHFLGRVAKETGQGRKRISKAALATLVNHRWPGNVRELLNSIRRAASLTDNEILDPVDFGFLAEIPAAPQGETITSLDDHLRETILHWSGRMELQEIANRLGVSRKTLWEKKKKWGL